MVNATFAAELLSWFDNARRQLPWRDRPDDPYAVWISEIMLQQTTVQTVVPFFERWMSRFPTVVSLAAAPMDDVLATWSGLGYYARARNLKRAAEAIVAAHGGKLPCDIATLTTLPGIGRYTAGAVASIAYGVRTPIVDVNVARVLSRLCALPIDTRSSASQKILWAQAESRLPSEHVGDYNQALMELGALICSVERPSCSICPVKAHCAGFASGNPTAFPLRKGVVVWTTQVDVSAVIERNGKLLVVQRPQSGLWGGLWEMPRCSAADGEGIEECAVRAVHDILGKSVVAGARFGPHRHVVMNRKIALYGVRIKMLGKIVESDASLVARWIDPAAANDDALPAPQRRLIEMAYKNTLHLELSDLCA